MAVSRSKINVNAGRTETGGWFSLLSGCHCFQVVVGNRLSLFSGCTLHGLTLVIPDNNDNYETNEIPKLSNYSSPFSSIFCFLNQFLGFNWFLYFVKSSLPTSKPPLQNTTSIKTRLVVDAITLVFVGRSKSGMIKVAAKKNPEKIIRNIPSFICRFFEFFIV